MGTVPSSDLFPRHVLEIVEVELVLEAHRSQLSWWFQLGADLDWMLLYLEIATLP